MQNTQHFNFEKHDQDEYFDIEHFNRMMDQVDAALYEVTNQAGRYVCENANILSERWAGTEVPFEYRLTSSAIGVEKDIRILPDQEWTEEQHTAWSAAKIVKARKSNGEIVLYAYGEKPALNFAIYMLIGNTVNLEGAVKNIPVSLPITASTGKIGTTFSGTKLSADANVNDANAQYQVIRKTNSSSGAVTLFEKTLSLELGCYACMLRIKSSIVNNSNNLLKLTFRKNNASGELIEENILKSNMLKSENKYQTIGSVIDLEGARGTKLYIKAELLQNAVQTEVCVDYLTISQAFTAISALG